MKLYTRLGIGLLLAVVLFGFSGRSAEAADFISQESYTLEAGDTFDDTLFVNAATVTIDGDINGDLFVAGNVVTINGTVDGNIFASGQNVTINGEATEDIFAGAGTLVFTGKAKDVRAGGANVTIGGEVTGDIMIGAGNAKLDGTVAGDAFIGAEVLDATDRSSIGGKLSYTTPEIDIDVEGVAESAEFFQDEEVAPSTGSLIWNWFLSTLLAVIGYVLVTYLLIRFVPGFLPRHDNALNNDLGTSIIWGLVSMVFLPIVIFILTVLVGIFFGFGGALAVAFTGFSGLGLIWLLSPIVIAHWLGTQFTDMGMTGILVAVAVAAILITLPLVGFIFALASYVLALGSAIMNISNNRNNTPDEPVEKAPAAA